MKPSDTSKKRIDPAAMAAALAAAPAAPVYDPENPPTTPQHWEGAIVSQSLQELREGLAARRMRGKGKRPAKVAISLRIAPETLAQWKATGPGWQTRMAERLAMP